MKHSLRQWYAGFVAATCLQSLTQDLLGKAECLRRMENGWVDWKISVPIAIVGLLAVSVWACGGKKGK